MTDTLRTRLQAAEARRRSAESDVTDLLAQLLDEAGVTLLSAERAGGEHWTLTVRVGADEAVRGNEAHVPAVPAEAAESETAAEQTPVVETKAVVDAHEAESAEDVAETEDAATDSGSESEDDLAPAPQATAAEATSADADEMMLPPLPTLGSEEDDSDEADDVDEESDTMSFAVDAEVEAASADDPLLAPLPELPDFQELVTPTTPVAPAPLAEQAPEVEEQDEEDDSLLLPPLPPLALLDDDDEVLAPDTDAVGAPASEETVELLGEPPLAPAPATAPPAEQEPADLATLLRNGSTDLRVQRTKEKRKNLFKRSSTDPRSRAERLARTLVSDMIAYGRERHDAALQKGVGAIREEFEADIETARAEYYAQVDESATPDRDAVFSKAVNDLLGNGQSVI